MVVTTLWVLFAVLLATAAAALAPSHWLQRIALLATARRRALGVAAVLLAAATATLALRAGSPAVESASAAMAPVAATGGAPGSPAAGGSLEQAAQTARRARDFPAAVAAFEQLARQGGMSADLWADYADALGAARGGLGESEPQIRQALALDPQHAKALWLLGSLQVERRDYRAALATWQSLLAVLPPDSSDARLVAANRDEAQALLGTVPVAGPATMPARHPVAAELRVDERWLKQP